MSLRLAYSSQSPCLRLLESLNDKCTTPMCDQETGQQKTQTELANQVPACCSCERSGHHDFVCLLPTRWL